MLYLLKQVGSYVNSAMLNSNHFDIVLWPLEFSLETK